MSIYACSYASFDIYILLIFGLRSAIVFGKANGQIANVLPAPSQLTVRFAMSLLCNGQIIVSRAPYSRGRIVDVWLVF